MQLYKIYILVSWLVDLAPLSKIPGNLKLNRQLVWGFDQLKNKEIINNNSKSVEMVADVQSCQDF